MSTRELIQTIGDLVIIVVCLAVCVYVAVQPSVAYAQTPKLVLFFILSLLAAILLASRLNPVDAHLEIKTKQVLFTASGATAVLFGLLMLLAYLTRPDEHAMVLSFQTDSENDLSLDAYTVAVTADGRDPSFCAAGSRAFILFRDDTPELTIRLRDDDATYTATFPPTPSKTLRLDRELRRVGTR